MKITAIIGTPRKKYSYEIVKIFENSFKQNGNVKFNYIFLNEVNLNFCKGCSICKDDENLCPLKDDFFKIKNKISDSDGIIFVSPVYENNISALMKNFFDRFHYLSFKPFYDPKKFSIIVAITAYTGLKATLKYLYFISSNFGLQNKGETGVLTSLYNTNIKYKNKIENKIEKIVYNIINKKNKFKPNLKDLLIYKDQKRRIITLKNRYPKAYQYWERKKWLSKKYFSDSNLNLFKKILVSIFNLSLSKN